MNPDKRFGQLEEVMAEMLQKQDRLEVLAVQTFELAFNTDTKVDELRDEVNGKFGELRDEVNDKFGELGDEVNGKFGELDAKIDTTARAVADLTVDNQREHQKINDRLDTIDGKFDDLMIYLKAKLG